MHLFFAVWLGLTCTPLAGQTATPDPPAWQRELDAIRLSEATAALSAGLKPAGADETQRRLGQLYRQLSAKYPDQVAVRKAAGDYYGRAGDTGAAIAEWQAAQKLDPSDADIASALGGARLRDGQTAAAREQFQRAVDSRPNVARYHFDLANVLFLFRHEFAGSPAFPDEATVLDTALAHYRRASELAGDNVDFARAYAETFYGLPHPDWTEGFTAWQHVRSLTSDAPDFANCHLARISLRLGKPAQAEAFLDAIHDPAFDPIKKILRRQAGQMERGVAIPPTP